MTTKVRGLVIRTADIKEADRLITLFTEELGVITAVAKGARSMKSRQMASTTQFCYGEYVLYQKGDYYWVKEASLIESFFDIRGSLEGLALAAYLCEVLSDVATAQPEGELLRLSLNSLYAIAGGNIDLDKVKAVFEIRAAAILGFSPDIVACHLCGERGGDFFFDIMGGYITCAACHAENLGGLDPAEDDGHERHIVCILSAGAKQALAYAIYCPMDKLFSFRLPPDDMHLFCRAAEAYLLNHLERPFKTLDFYYEVRPKTPERK
ncbi:MAG TPA: DNA repair protein RecO [Clostridiales bacterium]|nr:DNA repair protein RecO [Clostridiales bacterium]